MKVFMSLWTRGGTFRKVGQASSTPNSSALALKFRDLRRIDMWKLSLALAKKHYGEVELITDSPGAEAMEGLPFSHFHKVLDDLPNLPPTEFSSNLSCLAEQGSFGIFCEKMGVVPELLLNGSGSRKKYTHLMFKKNDADVMRRISERVSREPYNLDPNELPPEEWAS